MNSNRAMIPTMMVSMGLLEFFAAADVKPGCEEERNDGSDVNEVSHESRIGETGSKVEPERPAIGSFS
jgi:hypothetical protein